MASGFDCDELTDAYLDVLSRVWVEGSEVEQAIGEVLNYATHALKKPVGLSKGAAYDKIITR